MNKTRQVHIRVTEKEMKELTHLSKAKKVSKSKLILTLVRRELENPTL